MANFIGSLLQDARYSARNLARNPGFALISILTLALGIGASTTIFSIFNATLLRPIALPDPGRLMLVWGVLGNSGSAPNLLDFQKQSGSFESLALAASAGHGYNLSASGSGRDAEQIPGQRVSASFFSVLGVQPMLGRTFTPEEETAGRDHEVVLSYGLWKDRYHADASLLGRPIRLDGEDYTVVGVMPQSFTWQFWSEARKLWVPIGYNKETLNRGSGMFLGIARLKPGVGVAQARAEIHGIGARLREQYPADDSDMNATISPLLEFGMGRIQTVLITLMTAVLFVTLIACVNIANLLLARAAGRRKEFAMRRALGARAARIARQMMTESLVLGFTGGVAGLALAAASTQLVFVVFKLDQLNLPMRPIDSIPLDGRALAFAFAISCLTAVLFGLAPALGAWRAGLNESMKEGGRTGSSSGRNRLRNALVAAEVALALVVLCGAGLMIKSMARLLGVDPGFDPQNVVVMDMTLPQEAAYSSPPDLPRFCQDLNDHAGSLPGIRSVSAVADIPFSWTASRSFQVEGRPPADPGKTPSALYNVVCPNYFHTMGIPILEGREFTFRDTLNSPGVTVITQSFANRYWPNEDPIGKAILYGSKGPRLTVVGVVGDVHTQGLDNQARRQFFRPYTQDGWPSMSIVARTAGAPGAAIPSIQRALADTFVDRPVSHPRLMESILENSTNSRRFPMLLLSAFAAIALLLAAVGIIGVVGHSVTQRTPEIGIRMALGARSVDVLGLMIGGNMAWVLGGLAIGVAGSLGLTRLLAGLLFNVTPFDPMVIGGVAALLAAVALLACYLPARRAAKIDPLSALRCD